jgi:hypothetical protein
MERRIIHDKHRFWLWPSAAMLEKLLNKIFKEFGIS